MTEEKTNCDKNVSESEDEEIVAKGTKRKCIVESEEGTTDLSDSDEDEEETDDEDSDESGENSEGEDDSYADEESDSEYETEEEVETCSTKLKKVKRQPTLSISAGINAPSSSVDPISASQADVDSDSSTASQDGEVCAICLGKMRGNIGSPEQCDHAFCLECILEWSKSNNSCPQDRTPFLQIFVRKRAKGRIIKAIQIDQVKPDADVPPEEEDEEPTFCEVCGRCDREDTLLLCDGCDLGFHLECLNPPLSQVPVEEWFCHDCDQTQQERGPISKDVDFSEVAELLDEADNLLTRRHARNTTGPRRRLPRTRATERVIGRITRARIGAGNRLTDRLFAHLDFPQDSDEGDNASSSYEDSDLEPDNEIVSKLKPSIKRKPAKRRKITKKRKTRKTRKTTTRTKSTIKKTTQTTTKKTTTKTRKCRTKRKTTKRKGTKKRKKTKGKKRRRKGARRRKIPVPVVTPKARLAGVMGIHVPKNPWQLSLPTMKGGTCDKKDCNESVISQKYKMGLPSLCLLGNYSEMDYESVPDEVADAILVAGVRRRMPTTADAIARRKAVAASAMISSSVSLRSIPAPPISDAQVSSVSDILGDLMESQSRLHGVGTGNRQDTPKGKSNPLKGFKPLIRRHGLGGPDSPKDGSGNGVSNSNDTQNNSNSQSGDYGPSGGGGSDGNGAGGYGYQGNGESENLATDDLPLGCLPFGVVSEDPDPTGSKAYSSYLNQNSNSNDSYIPEGMEEFEKEKEEKEKTKTVTKVAGVEDIDLYSDIEPEADEAELDSEDNSDKEEEDKVAADPNQVPENEPISSGDELVIDDAAQNGSKKSSYPDNPYDERILEEQRQYEANAPFTLEDIPSPENEVGSTTLPGLKDFELEAVSDEDTQEMDKSMTSSISLSDSNMGDAEVTSSTTEQIQGERELKPPKLFGEVQRHLAQNMGKDGGMGLQALETETISDNEEICFDDAVESIPPTDEAIEEGEIPNETPNALPSVRPKINIQLRRNIEFPAVVSKEFDGEYEEGEIIDENREQKKREKARKEVDEVVNQSLDDGDESKKEDAVEGKANVDPEPNIVANNAIVGPALSEPDLSSPEKVRDADPVEVDEREKRKEKKDRNKDGDKDKHKGEKNKDKDISFKKVSKSSKVRNYRENEKESRSGRRGSRDRDGSGEKNKRGRNKDRSGERYRDRSGGRRKDRDSDFRNKDFGKDFGKDFPKRREMERYNVRQMINKKEEERKKKDEFGRDVALRSDRPSRSRSKSRTKKKRKRSRSDQRSKNQKKDGRGRRRSYSSSSSSSGSSSSSSSSYSSSSSSSSRSPRRRRKGSKSPVRKKADTGKKKAPVKAKDKKQKGDKADNAVAVEKKKEEKKKDKNKTKEVNGVANLVSNKGDKRKTKKRGKGGPRSKEVYQAGGSIMVSVNFSRKEKEKKKRDREMRLNMEQRQRRREKSGTQGSPYRMWASTSPGGGKRTPLQDEPMWSPELQNRIGMKSPDMVDLDVIMLSPPPQEPILISDSEDDGGITRLPPDLGVQLVHSPRSPHRSAAVHSGGPKTPPEPGVKFTLSTKQVLKPINNPLMEEEEEDDDDDDAVVEVIPSRGPNTPPGAPPESDDGLRNKSPMHPGSPSSPEPDVYDPFDPTKSPSPNRGSPQQEARVTSSDQMDSDKVVEKTTQKVSPPSKSAGVRVPVVSPSAPAPPLPAEPPKSKERPPEPKQKLPEDEASSTAAVTHLPISATLKSPTKAAKVTKASSIASTLPQKSTTAHIMGPPPTVPSQPHVALPPTTILPPALNPVQQLFAGLPANVANILYPAALAAAAVRGAQNSILRANNQAPSHTVLPPDFSRPPPANLSQPPPMLISPSKEKKDKSTYNGHHHMDLVDMDLGSPSSPDSSGMSDIFEPPSPHSTVYAGNNTHERPSPRKRPQPGAKSMKKGDRFDTLFGGSGAVKPSSMQKVYAKTRAHKRAAGMLGKKLDPDDDIPSSAVEMQLLKKVQRQERVVEEVKLCLKPYYNRKTVSKEDYKDIMKKCVVKVCHNKSGEINPNKIRALVEGYVKKVKYYRKKTGSTGGIGALLPPSANDPPPPGFKMKP